MPSTSLAENIGLLDIFSREQLQEKQDLFSEAMGVASVITLPDGTPVTEASNFCDLCNNLIRKTKKGQANCIASDTHIGKLNLQGPNIQTCLSGGLWDAGVSITIGDKHLGNWLIGQVKNEHVDEEKILRYADEIGINREPFSQALEKVPVMTLDKFEKIAKMLFAFVNELTKKAYNNLLLNREIAYREEIEKELRKNEEKLKDREMKLERQNHDLAHLNDELRRSNEELLKALNELDKSQRALKRQNDDFLSINEELNQANEKYIHLNEMLNKKNEQYFSLNEEIRLTNFELQKTLDKLTESNTRNESLLSAIPDTIFVLSLDDVFQDFHVPDPDALFLPPEVFIGQPIDKLLPASIVKEHITAREQLLETGKPQNYQYSFQTSDGAKYFDSTMVKHGDDKVLCIVRDITQVRKSRELEQEVQLTRKAAEFKQKFLANMSHEIRTPLTGMMGLADILAKTNLDEEQKDYVENLRQSGENLRHIINLILDYSKIESGQIKIKPVVVKTSSLFDTTTNLFGTLSHKSVELKTEISPSLPQYIKVDINRLNQILNNLTSNAIKFTDEGSISLYAVPGEPIFNPAIGDIIKVKISIKDTGIGIDPTLQQHLFKPFSQIESSELRTIEGTGLGLSICRELTTLLGGNIGVISEPGKGSTFWFTFTAEVADMSSIIISDKEIVNGHNSSGIRVMVVEDKKINQMVVSLLLKDMGHSVFVANNGMEAISTYQPNSCDLILMDIQMPVMDGITATRKLRENHKKLPPIVGLSANAFEGDREKYISMGLDDYLTKPLKQEDIGELIWRLVKKK